MAVRLGLRSNFRCCFCCRIIIIASVHIGQDVEVLGATFVHTSHDAAQIGTAVSGFAFEFLFCCFCCGIVVTAFVHTGHNVADIGMPRMKIEARVVADHDMGKRRTKRKDGDGPSRIIKASVIVLDNRGDDDLALLPLMEEFLCKEMKSILAEGVAGNTCDSSNEVHEDIPEFQPRDPYLPLVHSSGVHANAVPTIDEESESVGVKATQEGELTADEGNCLVARLHEVLCDISVELQGDTPAEQRPLRLEITSQFNELRSILQNVSMDDLAM
ncbi:hypothetical protein L7F22_025017 [Adiantum nelumboides]|nr:hypothetical protein [Adiantum nelumboides]